MSLHKRRYLFTTYSDLITTEFEALHKVCDRLFIFIPANTDSIPLRLVQKIQKLGKGVKWIPLKDDTTGSVVVHLAFLLGRLHEKIPTDIEFAILSDDVRFDALVQFIFAKKRNCIRVKKSSVSQNWKAEEPAKIEFRQILSEEIQLPIISKNGKPEKTERTEAAANNNQPPLEKPKISATISETPKSNAEIMYESGSPEEYTVRETAAEIIDRLVRSGNRPAEIATLKQYIALSQANPSNGIAEKVVTFMALNNDIEIRELEVLYNF